VSALIPEPGDSAPDRVCPNCRTRKLIPRATTGLGTFYWCSWCDEPTGAAK
jgi:hypothetical protein